MNRIVLIGNGFDLAHGLKTRYEDFVNWYWRQRVIGFFNEYSNTSIDPLCTFIVKHPGANWNGFFNRFLGSDKEQSLTKMWNIINDDKNLYEIKKSIFFENICKSIETKKWVDIENEYYRLLVEYSIKEKSDEKIKELNKQLHFLQDKLIEFLKEIDKPTTKIITNILDEIYAPIEIQDISIKKQDILNKVIDAWLFKDESLWRNKKDNYKHYDIEFFYNCAKEFIEKYKKTNTRPPICSSFFRLPDNIILLSFNYTKTAQLYITSFSCSYNYIHGELNIPKSIIFGYGDELDKNYKDLQEYNNNECLCNVKSIKYLEADNYRKILELIESDAFQIYIMGHSCGNSDRTLLNTLFEHENCISIKPYYYQKDDGTDNYTELIQNISRNFTDMKLMRDRVVNKIYCKPLPQNK